MIKVYIASPYSKGDVAWNVRQSIDMANKLIDYGYAPYCPLLTHFQHMIHPQPYNKWLELDIEFMLTCDAVLRFGGESPGADKEVAVAKRNKIPVFYNIQDLLREMPPNEPL